MGTAIPYADEVWDFFVGCKPVSSGCANCWAPGLCGGRLSHLPGYGDVVEKRDERWQWNGEVSDVGKNAWCEKPGRWRKPRVIFVQSKSDLFYEPYVLGYLEGVVRTARECPQHTFLILTKRPEIMAECVAALDEPLPPNIYLGVSVEDQATADERLDVLDGIPAAKKWLSYEPALDFLDLSNWLWLDWVVAGCESGPRRRHAEADWFRVTRDECAIAGIPFYLKQMESCIRGPLKTPGVRGKVVTLPELDGVRHDALPWEVRDEADIG